MADLSRSAVNDHQSRLATYWRWSLSDQICGQMKIKFRKFHKAEKRLALGIQKLFPYATISSNMNMNMSA